MDKITIKLFEKIKDKTQEQNPEYDLEIKEFKNGLVRIGDHLDLIDDTMFRHGGTRHTDLLLSILCKPDFIFYMDITKNKGVLPNEEVIMHCLQQSLKEVSHTGLFYVKGRKRNMMIASEGKYEEKYTFLQSISNLSENMSPFGVRRWDYNDMVHLAIQICENEFNLIDYQTKSGMRFSQDQFPAIQEKIDSMTIKYTAFLDSLPDKLAGAVGIFNNNTMRRRRFELLGKVVLDDFKIHCNDSTLLYGFSIEKQYHYAENLEELYEIIKKQTISFYKKHRLQTVFRS